MRKIWFLIVGFFAVASLLVGCGAERAVGVDPVTQETVQASNELAEKQAELDALKLEKLEADKKELEAELAEKEASEKEAQANEATASKADIVEEAFLESLRDKVPELKTADDASLVELGEMVCEKIESGTSVISLVGVTEEGGFTYDESIDIVGTAIGSYCPDELGSLS